MRFRLALLSPCSRALAADARARRCRVRRRGVTAEVTADARDARELAVAQRSWDRAAVRSTIVDRRGGDRTWSEDAPDFTLELSGQKISSTALRITRRRGRQSCRGGGLRVTMTLVDDTLPGLEVTRVAEAYPGVAGFRTQTTVASTVPLLLSAATLDEAAVGTRVAPAISAFRAGSDWRDPDWTGPQFTLGDAHPGTWRETRTAAAGTALRGPGEWLSVARRRRRTVRGDGAQRLPVVDGSSMTARPPRCASTSRATSSSLGPFEESGHVENPVADGPGPRAAGHGSRAGAARRRSSASRAATATRPGSSIATWSSTASIPTRTTSSSTPTAPTRTGSRPARRTTWTTRRSRRSRRSPAAWASTRSSSTTAGRRRPATGSPTRRSTPSRAASSRPASPTRRSARSATRSRRCASAYG